MSKLQRYVLNPSPGMRDAYMGIGGLFLILAIIAFAGASLTYDESRRALLRPLGTALGIIGALCWVRGSIVPHDKQE